MLDEPQPTSLLIGNELRQYIALLRRWVWLLLLATLLAGVAAYIASKQITPTYQATTTVLVNEADSSQNNEYQLNITRDRLPRTYAEMMKNTPVLETVSENVEGSLSVEKLNKAVTVQPVRDTQLIEITVEDTDPVRAANIANTLVDVFANRNETLQTSRFTTYKENLETRIAQVEQQIEDARSQLSTLENATENEGERERLQTSLEQYRQVYTDLLQTLEQVRFTEVQSTSNIVQVEPATPPDNPIRPRTLTNTLLAAVVGCMLAVGGVFLYEYLDDTLKDPAVLTEVLDLPVLGLIASHTVDNGQPIAANQPRSPITEAFRSLRTNIQYASIDRDVRTMIITSAEPAAGKSTVISNLAIVLAHSGERTVLIEGDLRRPKLHRLMDISNRVGLSELFVQDDLATETVTQKTKFANLDVIPAGEKPPNPSELLGSARMKSILQQLQDRYDRIIIDAPPLMAVTDAAVLSAHVDGVLLVAKPGQTTLPALQQTVTQLRRVGAKFMGVVLNDVNLGDSRYGYYYDGYYYSYEDAYGDDTGRNAGRQQPDKWKKPPLPSVQSET